MIGRIVPGPDMDQRASETDRQRVVRLTQQRALGIYLAHKVGEKSTDTELMNLALKVTNGERLLP